MKIEILLGDTVKCKYTNVSGVVVSKTEYINGCTQLGIAQKQKAGTLATPESQFELSIDEQSLILVKKGERHEEDEEEERTGGRMNIIKRRNY